MNLQMVDLKGQYQKIKVDVDQAIQEVIDSTAFINGPQVSEFQADLEQYLGVKKVVTCANGTDALQIALMALGLEPGDEVIVPCFTYVATAEVIALLRLKPVMVDVDPSSYNVTAEIIEKAITPKTKAVVPVHLFGQCADMESILRVAKKHKLFVVEDAAQALGAEYTFADGSTKKAGTMGDVGCTSFFPSKNLGCYGDGGALMTNDEQLADTIRKIANHGQAKKYYHDVVGVNSRLDTLQASILKVKLRQLDKYAEARNAAATFYDESFAGLDWLTTPKRSANSSHVFNQYTLKIDPSIDRDEFKKYLADQKVPSMVYYPVPLNHQNAFKTEDSQAQSFPVSEALCKQVISLPIHTEMTGEQLNFIVAAVQKFKA